MQNNSGIVPKDTKCLVLPDPIAEKVGSIIIADETKEKMGWKQQKCTLIARGASAFHDWLPEDKPEPGDRVFVSQYSGSRIETDGGEVYWIIKDEDIIGGVL